MLSKYKRIGQNDIIDPQLQGSNNILAHDVHVEHLFSDIQAAESQKSFLRNCLLLKSMKLNRILSIKIIILYICIRVSVSLHLSYMGMLVLFYNWDLPGVTYFQQSGYTGTYIEDSHYCTIHLVCLHSYQWRVRLSGSNRQPVRPQCHLSCRLGFGTRL